MRARPHFARLHKLYTRTRAVIIIVFSNNELSLISKKHINFFFITFIKKNCVYIIFCLSFLYSFFILFLYLYHYSSFLHCFLHFILTAFLFFPYDKTTKIDWKDKYLRELIIMCNICILFHVFLLFYTFHDWRRGKEYFLFSSSENVIYRGND